MEYGRSWEVWDQPMLFDEGVGGGAKMLTVPTFQTWMRITDRELGWRVAGSIKAAYPGVPNSCTVAGKKILVNILKFRGWGRTRPYLYRTNGRSLGGHSAHRIGGLSVRFREHEKRSQCLWFMMNAVVQTTPPNPRTYRCPLNPHTRPRSHCSPGSYPSIP